LIDYTVEWDDDKAIWYTPWVQEVKVLGREDRFVVKATTVDGAKRPTAKVYIEYDSNGNGIVNAVSECIEVGHKERIHEIDEVPVDEDGYYRMRIEEYSGYNSLTSLNMGIVN